MEISTGFSKYKVFNVRTFTESLLCADDRYELFEIKDYSFSRQYINLSTKCTGGGVVICLKHGLRFMRYE